ncbi:MAG: 3-hydroxyacyl-CoA dehydrogenase family protein [Promethearchaeota archaeon]
MVDIENIKNVTVVGAGLMGAGIAQLALIAGFKKVVLNDIKMEFIERGVKQIEYGAYEKRQGLRALESRGKLGEGITTEALLGRLVKEVDLAKAVEDADFVVEAVPEVMKIKQEVFKKLGKYTPLHAILATNTSTMSITKIGRFSGRPKQVIGMHFNTPLLGNRLIEVIRGQYTSDEVMDACVAFGEKFPCPYFKSKMYVARIEKERPGFIVNRLFCANAIYFNWIATKALEKGIPWEQLDADMAITGKEMGFFEILDYIGLDVICDGIKYLKETLTPDIEAKKFLIDMVKAGNLGAKTGKGFYEWPKGGRPKIDKSKKAGLIDLEYLMAIQLNEGCRILEEGVVKGYNIINKTIMAIGMPSAFTMAKTNYQKWAKMLEDLAEKTGKNYLKPCALMKSGDFLNMRK